MNILCFRRFSFKFDSIAGRYHPRHDCNGPAHSAHVPKQLLLFYTLSALVGPTIFIIIAISHMMPLQMQTAPCSMLHAQRTIDQRNFNHMKFNKLLNLLLLFHRHYYYYYF